MKKLKLTALFAALLASGVSLAMAQTGDLKEPTAEDSTFQTEYTISGNVTSVSKKAEGVRLEVDTTAGTSEQFDIPKEAEVSGVSGLRKIKEGDFVTLTFEEKGTVSKIEVLDDANTK